MANILDNVMPKILASGLLALRRQALTPFMVNMNYENDAANPGDVVNVPVAPDGAVTDVTPGAAPVQSQSLTPGLTQIPLDKWKKYDFFLTDGDLVKIDANRHFMPLTMSDAFSKLANQLDADVFDNYRAFYNYVGVAQTTPFGSGVTEAIDARTKLNKSLAPTNDRRIVLGPDAEGSALARPELGNFEQTGDQAVKIEGVLGRKYGFDWAMSQSIGSHTKGTAGSVTVASTTAAGATTIGLTAGTGGTLVLGDVFTIAGDTTTYVVTSSVTVATSTAVAIAPALAVAATSGSIVTVKNSHTVNLALQRQAVTLATRPILQAAIDYELGNRMLEMSDPVTGFSLRLEISRQYKQTSFVLDTVYGSKAVRPQFGCRIAG